MVVVPKSSVNNVPLTNFLLMMDGLVFLAKHHPLALSVQHVQQLTPSWLVQTFLGIN